MRRGIKRGCLGSLLVLLLLLAAAVTVVWAQARRTPDNPPEYVALGSSFAAGAGLGPLQDDSPWLCARSVNGYPQQLARRLRYSTVDMSCGGAVTRHLLRGGQFFHGAQLRVVAQDTRLVTITVGGNDISYIGDLSMLAASNSGSLFGRLASLFWSGPKAESERNYARLRNELAATIRTIRGRAPKARIALATYPTILPPHGTCRNIGLSVAEADRMREVANRLAATTRTAAQEGGALVVDMNALGAAHNACSSEPWTFGWANAGAAPFHPTLRGAQATATAVAAALNRLPAGVAAVREDDASGHQARSIRRQE